MTLTSQAIAAVDTRGMLGDVLAQPHQYEDAIWRTDSAGIEPGQFARGVLICGMGGSAFGADLAAPAAGTRAPAPIPPLPGSDPPAWPGPASPAGGASYPGNPRETLP